MCDYCGCRSVPVIEDLAADHENLHTLGHDLRRLIEAGDAAAAAALDAFRSVLDRHCAVEEAGVFAGLRAAGELVDHVDALTVEHGAMTRALDHLDTQDPAWPSEVLAVLDELHDHMCRENYDLFPATLLALDPHAWDRIEDTASQARRHAA